MTAPLYLVGGNDYICVCIHYDSECVTADIIIWGGESSGTPCLVAHRCSSIHEAYRSMLRELVMEQWSFLESSVCISVLFPHFSLAHRSSRGARTVQIKEIKPNKWLHE